MTNILVAGGAGYIGSHTCLDLFNKGFIPVTYDNLSNGHADFVKWGPLETGDIRDLRKLDDVIRKYRPATDGDCSFCRSDRDRRIRSRPRRLLRQHVSGTISLLLAAQAAGVDKIVFFALSCATYGIPVSMPMGEGHP